jgi:hypothetical protein
MASMETYAGAEVCAAFFTGSVYLTHENYSVTQALNLRIIGRV